MPSMNQSQSCKQCKEPPQCQQKCQQQPQPRCIQSQPKCQKPPQPRCIQSQPACPKQSQPRCIQAQPKCQKPKCQQSQPKCQQSQPKCQQSQPKCQQSQPRCEEDADDAAACCPSKGPARGCPAPCGNERGRKCGAAPCRARTGGCGAPRNPCCPSPARPSSLRVNRAAQLCLPGGRSRLCLTRPTCNRMTGQDGMNGNQGVCNGPSRDQLFRCCPKPRLKPPPSPISCDALCCNPCKFNSQTRGKKKRCRQAPSCCDCACNSKNR
ncbi:unnamed protein product [Bemisia tabaci]|uniref:Uncharacterized protein n=1 Tax=Bemisia tabaci TaxID=7038 RepID=A0A9P0G3A3_BEMTA|nr:unnamed protein product [Bemisia tabaci]